MDIGMIITCVIISLIVFFQIPISNLFDKCCLISISIYYNTCYLMIKVINFICKKTQTHN